MLLLEVAPFNQLRNTKNKSVFVLKGVLPVLSSSQPLKQDLVHVECAFLKVQKCDNGNNFSAFCVLFLSIKYGTNY